MELGTESTPPPPSVPGLRLLSLLRFSRSGETWLAQDGAAACAVTLVPGALVSSAEPLTRLRHAHALGVDAVLAAGRNVALRTQVPPEATLASLLAVRHSLDPGEVVTVGVPVAQALSAAHDRGIMHGDLDPADVALDDAGRPIVTGIGLAGLAGHPSAPADDVLALAMILRALLGDDAGPRAEAVRAALGDALSGQAAARPSAAELAQRLGLACPPQPLRWPRPAVTPTSPEVPASDSARARAGVRVKVRPRAGASPHPAGRRRAAPAVASSARLADVVSALRSRLPGTLPMPGRAALAAILTVAGLALLLVVAPMVSGTHTHTTQASGMDDFSALTDSEPSTTPTGALPTGAPSPSALPAVPAVPTPSTALTTDWTGVARTIAAARDAAFSGVPGAGLQAADAEGSSASAIDFGRLAQLKAAGVHARGLTTTIHAVTPIQVGPAITVLHLREATSAYDLVTDSGVVIEHRAPTRAAMWTITLVQGPAGWRTATATLG